MDLEFSPCIYLHFKVGLVFYSFHQAIPFHFQIDHVFVSSFLMSDRRKVTGATPLFLFFCFLSETSLRRRFATSFPNIHHTVRGSLIYFNLLCK